MMDNERLLQNCNILIRQNLKIGCLEFSYRNSKEKFLFMEKIFCDKFWKSGVWNFHKEVRKKKFFAFERKFWYNKSIGKEINKAKKKKNIEKFFKNEICLLETPMFDKNFFPIRRQKLKIGCLKFSIYEGFNCYRGVLRYIYNWHLVNVNFCIKFTKL